MSLARVRHEAALQNVIAQENACARGEEVTLEDGMKIRDIAWLVRIKKDEIEGVVVGKLIQAVKPSALRLGEQS